MEIREGRIEGLPVDNSSVDCVVSNGCQPVPGQDREVAEVGRVLDPRGVQLAIADIITEQPLTQAIVCNADLRTSCIGGHGPAGGLPPGHRGGRLHGDQPRGNVYEFISDRARKASAKTPGRSASS